MNLRRAVLRSVPVLGWTILPLVLLAAEMSHAQAAREMVYDWEPGQLTAVYQWTTDDYSLRVPERSPERIRLNGAAIEYAWRGFYPWEFLTSVGYSQGGPLSQHLVTVQAGPGYCRGFKNIVPFAHLLLGVARTSSSGNMYLYASAKSGVAISTSTGVDYTLSPRVGVRLMQLQYHYLPFGEKGSVYWSFGAGISYRLQR